MWRLSSSFSSTSAKAKGNGWRGKNGRRELNGTGIKARRLGQAQPLQRQGKQHPMPNLNSRQRSLTTMRRTICTNACIHSFTQRNQARKRTATEHSNETALGMSAPKAVLLLEDYRSATARAWEMSFCKFWMALTICHSGGTRLMTS